MKLLKAVWTPFAAIGLFALTIFAAISAARHKSNANKWAQKALDIEEGNVVKGVENAEVANKKAALHDRRAAERKSVAETRITQIGAKNESIADILDNWRKP